MSSLQWILLTNSKSVLEALRSKAAFNIHSNTLIIKIKYSTRIFIEKQISVNFVWIKAYSNMERNDITDKLVKEAISITRNDDIQINSVPVPHFKQKSWEKWNLHLQHFQTLKMNM